MKNGNTFTWTRLMRTMVALLVIMSMLLCGCAKSGGGDGDGDGGNKGGNSGSIVFGDGDGNLEAQDLVDSLTNLYGAMLSSGGGNRPDDFGCEMSLEVTIGDLLLDQLGAAMSQAGLDSDLSWFETIGLDMQIASKGDMMQTAVDASLNGKKIIGMDVIMDMAGNMGYIGIPELNDKYIASEVDFSSMNVMMKSYMASMGEYSAMMNAMPTDEELNSVLTRYLNVVLENIEDPIAGTTSLSAGNINKDVATKTYNFNQKNMLVIVEKVLTTAKTDSELENLLDGFSEAMNIIGEKQAEANNGYWSELDIHAELMEVIDPALESLEEAKQEADETVAFSVVAYVDGSSQIGFCLQMNNGYTMIPYVQYYALKDGKNTSLFVNLMGSVYFTGAGTMDGNKVDGNYMLSVQNQELLYLELVDFDTNSLQRGQLKGTVRLSFSDFALRNLFGSNLPISEDTVIELVFAGGNTTEVAINIFDGNTLLFGIALSYKLTSGGNIQVPNKYVDAENSNEMSQWMEGMKTDGILNSLKSAGVPNELMEMLEEALKGGFAVTPQPVPTAPGYYG